MIQPPDAQYYHGGLYYKIGLHGFVYLYLLGSWVKTTKPLSDLTNHEIEKVKLC